MTRTIRSEMRGFVQKLMPQPGSDLVGYSYGPTEGFMQTILSQRFMNNYQRTGSEIDGNLSGLNDDFYRRTGYLYKMTTSEAGSITGRRTELSLARQLATKQDQEAVIRVVTRSKNYKKDNMQKAPAYAPLMNIVPPYTKFFLEAVSEDRVEKAQIVETFGDFIAFFFGHRPEIYNFSGRLLNAKNHDWKNDFQEMYDFFLRGTKAVENNSTVFIQYDDVIAEGFLMNSHLEYHGTDNNECPFSFSMLVTERAPVNQLQRLQERRSRSRFSAAEQQLIEDIQKLQGRDSNIPFAIIQRALAGDSLSPSDIILFTQKTNKVKPSNPKPTTEKDIDAMLANVEDDQLEDVLGNLK